MLDRDLETDELELQALVPVSVRTENEHGELGNRLTAMRGPLPVHIADPFERLRFVTKAMDALKASKQALGAEAIWGLNDWFREFAPPLLLNPTAAINFSTRLFNMLVTNFPGPQVPFYVLGRELTAVYPIGFLAQRHALAIAMFSYNGHDALRPARRPRDGRSADIDAHRLLDIDGEPWRSPRRRRDSLRRLWRRAGRRSSTWGARGAERPRPRPRTRPSAAASSAACARASRKAARR